MNSGAYKIGCVVGARPNFVKIAPILRALDRYSGITTVLVHTGQHYDLNMSESFFQELSIPFPDRHLEVGSGSHAQQTGRVMERFEKVCLEERFDRVVVVGDVNSTMACTLAAAKLLIPVAHVEAGLRSFDRTMPEEINRILTDTLCDLLLVSEPSGVENLKHEGITGDRVHLVGNIMIDTLYQHLPGAKDLQVAGKLGMTPGAFGLLTMHRPSNVDDPEILKGLLAVLGRISTEIPLVFPAHPRTRKAIADIGGLDRHVPDHKILMAEPMSYRENLSLMASANLVLTDSGGMQEETTVLGVPCLTLRENTERPITVDVGTSVLVGNSPVMIYREFRTIMDGTYKRGEPVPLWDGHAGERIAALLEKQTG